MITLTNLGKDYGTFTAVRELNLDVPAGELFCFLGPNGAGKTTTIKMLTGLLRPTRGRATIAGIDIQQQPIEAKKVIGYVPDMPFLYDRLTVQEFLEFTIDLYDLHDATADMNHVIRLFSLDPQRNALIKDLSHGMRQRLIYAAAFLHNPTVLFIDEPLIGLDPYTIRLIKTILRTKTKEGMTIFLTTHILALAEDIADRIAIIMRGEIIALGTLSALKEAHDGQTLEDVFLKLTGGDLSLLTE